MQFFQLDLSRSEALPHPEELVRRRRISVGIFANILNRLLPPRCTARRGRNEALGFSLVELLLTISAVGFLVILIASIPNSINLIGRSRHQSIAREIIAKEIEDKRAIIYLNLANGETSISDTRLKLLPAGLGKILVEDCDLNICTNGENVKQLTITITWMEVSKLQTAKVKTLIAEGGLNQ